MNTRKHLLVASMSLALAACGGGGSGDEGNPKPDDQGNSPGNGSNPPEATIAALCDANYQTPPAPEGDIVGGTASSVRSGTVSVYEWNGQGWPETPSQTTTTDDHGRFAFSSLGDLSGPMRFELTGNANTRLRCESPTGCGSTEPGDYRIMPLGYKLSAIVNSDELSNTGNIAITPVTNIAAQWAMDMPRGLTPEAMGLSAARVQTLFGLDDDFATSLPTAIADCGAISSASSGDQNHAIVSAAFADLAEDEGYGLTLMVEGAAYMYSLLGGQVLTGSGDISKQDIEQLLAQYPQYSDAAQDVLDLIPFDNLSLAGLDRLMQSAGDVVRGLEEGDAFTSSEGDSLRSSFSGLVSTWNDRPVTNLIESTGIGNQTDFNTGKTLLDIYDDYRQSALDAEAEIDAANRNLGWLYIDEAAVNNTTGLVNTISDALNWAIEGATCVAVHDEFNLIVDDCSLSFSVYTSAVDEDNRVSFASGSPSIISLNGTWEGNQTVDLDIGVENILDLFRLGTLRLELNGSITNGTAVTTFNNFALDLDVTENDLMPFQGLDVYDFIDEETITPLLDDLVADLNIRMALGGAVSIASTDSSIGTYNITGMDTALRLNRRVITQNEAGPVLSYSSTSTIENPAGETKGPVDGIEMYTLLLDDPLTLQSEYRFENLGLPPMEVEAGGELSGYEGIASTLTTYFENLLAENPDASQIDYEAVYAELETLFGGMDFTALALNGDNELRIFSEDGSVLEQTYTLTTETDGGVSITDGNTAEVLATLYIRGAAGYIYTNDTLVAVANFGDETEGLLVSLVDGDQRTYPSVTRDDEEALQAATWTLLESLFGDLFTAD